MRLFGGGKPKKKLSNKKQLKNAFDIQLNTTARDRAAMAREAAKDKAIAILAREKKKQAERDAMLERAEALKAAALERREKAARDAAAKRRAAKDRADEVAAQRQACTCRKPRLDKQGKCTRCGKKPGGPVRRRR